MTTGSASDAVVDVASRTASVYGGDVTRSLLFTTVDEPGRHVVRVAVAATLPGRGGRLHYHPDTDEMYFILSGTAEVELDGRRVPLEENSCVRIARGTRHRIANTGDDTLRYVAFHVGASSFDGAVEHIEA